MEVLSFDGQTWAQSDVDVAGVREQVRKDTLTWIRAAGLPVEALEALRQVFEIHPLAMEDVQSARQRPKVEAYGDLTFTVVRIPRWHDELEWIQVGLFMGPDYLITASNHKLPELDVVAKRLLGKGLPRPAVVALFHQALDALVDAWFPYMDELESLVEELEAKASQRADHETLTDIREVKQVTSKTRKVTGPMRDAILGLERGDYPNVDADARIYLRDVSDHMVRLAERLEHVKEMSMIAQESWNATLANSQNQAMKRLTVVFALFLVPTFLAGLGGMNFEGVPDWPFETVALALSLIHI